MPGQPGVPLSHSIGWDSMGQSTWSHGTGRGTGVGHRVGKAQEPANYHTVLWDTSWDTSWDTNCCANKQVGQRPRKMAEFCDSWWDTSGQFSRAVWDTFGAAFWRVKTGPSVAEFFAGRRHFWAGNRPPVDGRLTSAGSRCRRCSRWHSSVAASPTGRCD